MKITLGITCLMCILALVLSRTVNEAGSRSPQNVNLLQEKSFDVHVSKQKMEEILVAATNNATNRVTGAIIAVLNEYTDLVLVNIRDLMIINSLDPMELPDNTLKLFPTGKITLSDGWLQETSSIDRSGDVLVSYSSSTKLLEVELPLTFELLHFTYNYHTKIVLLSIKGEAAGRISDVKIKTKLSFDFNTYQASLDTFSITDAGSMSLQFSGNSLVDWMTNTMTSVVIPFIEPVISDILENIVKDTLESSVVSLNYFISTWLTI